MFYRIFILLSLFLTTWHILTAQISGDACLEEATQALQEKDYASAIDLFSCAIEDEPIFEAYAGRAKAYYELGEYELALDDTSFALQFDPYNSEVLSHKILILDDLGRLDQTLAEYDRLIEENPDDPYLYYVRATIYIFIDDYERALDDLVTVISLDSNIYIVYAARGLVYFELEMDELAQQDFMHITRFVEDDPWLLSTAYSSLGFIEYEAENYPDAIYFFSESNQHLETALTLNYLGLAQLRNDQIVEAIDSHTRAIEVDSELLEGYFLRGQAYFFLGDYEAAILDLEIYIELAGGDVFLPALDLLEDAYANRESSNNLLEAF